MKLGTMHMANILEVAVTRETDCLYTSMARQVRMAITASTPDRGEKTKSDIQRSVIEAAGLALGYTSTDRVKALGTMADMTGVGSPSSERERKEIISNHLSLMGGALDEVDNLTTRSPTAPLDSIKQFTAGKILRMSIQLLAFMDAPVAQPQNSAFMVLAAAMERRDTKSVAPSGQKPS